VPLNIDISPAPGTRIAGLNATELAFTAEEKRRSPEWIRITDLCSGGSSYQNQRFAALATSSLLAAYRFLRFFKSLQFMVLRGAASHQISAS
jgi:hypothetical protein